MIFSTLSMFPSARYVLRNIADDNTYHSANSNTDGEVYPKAILFAHWSHSPQPTLIYPP
jgi:hypothetical protein